MITDPAKVLEDAISACLAADDAHDAASDKKASAFKMMALEEDLVRACRDNFPALLAELRQLREVVMRLPAILNDIDVNDELSINCRAGTFLVEVCPSFKTIGGHNNSILDALAWLRGTEGIAAVDAARKAAKP